MNGFALERYGKSCYDCSAKDNLTRHHLKNPKGMKTGEIRILCRDCHNAAEESYRLYGITHKLKKLKLNPNQKLQLDYMNGKIQFYSSR